MILRFYLYNQKYDRKIERNKSLPKYLLVIFVADFVADGKLFYSRWTLPKKVPSALLKKIYIYQYLFTFASTFVLPKVG